MDVPGEKLEVRPCIPASRRRDHFELQVAQERDWPTGMIQKLHVEGRRLPGLYVLPGFVIFPLRAEVVPAGAERKGCCETLKMLLPSSDVPLRGSREEASMSSPGAQVSGQEMPPRERDRAGEDTPSSAAQPVDGTPWR